jgi:acetyl esterase/lipase
MRKLFLLLLSTAFISTALAADYKFERDINYRTDDDYATKMCRIDIASPEGVKDAPVIVWFHGGGLTGGHREIPQQLLKDYIVVGVGYRFSPNVKVTQIVDDAACAVAWVFNNIEKWGGNPESIYIAGHSAGGYLVTMVGLEKARLECYGIDANKLKGIIPFSGQAITHFEERRSRGIANTQPIVDELSPLFHVRGDAAPILILSGDREMEMLGRYEENAYMWRVFQLVGHKDATLYELDGYGHNMCEPAYPLLMRFVREHEKKNK